MISANNLLWEPHLRQGSVYLRFGWLLVRRLLSFQIGLSVCVLHQLLQLFLYLFRFSHRCSSSCRLGMYYKLNYWLSFFTWRRNWFYKSFGCRRIRSQCLAATALNRLLQRTHTKWGKWWSTENPYRVKCQPTFALVADFVFAAGFTLVTGFALVAGFVLIFSIRLAKIQTSNLLFVLDNLENWQLTL